MHSDHVAVKEVGPAELFIRIMVEEVRVVTGDLSDACVDEKTLD